MSVMRRSHAIRTRLTSAAALATMIAGLSIPAFGQNGGNTGSTDYVASLNSTLFSVAPGMNVNTRYWMNQALNGMGSPTKLGQIVKTEFECELVGGFGKMTLAVMSSSTGEMTFSQVLRPATAGIPGRSIAYTLSTSPAQFTASSNGGDPLVITPTAECIAMIRRTADLWNPVLTMMGQFGSVDSLGAAMVGTTPCAVLNMGSPRMAGMTSGRIYLNVNNYLVVATETTVTRDIPISGKYTIIEWQSVSGITLPKKVVMEGPDGVALLTFTTIRLYGASGLLL